MMTVRKSGRSVKLRPIKYKTGRQMLEELGYKECCPRKGQMRRFRKDCYEIGINRSSRTVSFYLFDDPCSATKDEILALAQMIKDGELQ